MMQEAAMSKKPDVPGGLIAGAVVLAVLAVVPLLSMSMQSHERPGALPVALAGIVVNLGFAALLYVVVKPWVRVLVALRAVAGVVLGLMKGFELREQAGEWTDEGMMQLLGVGLSAVLFVILLLPISTIRRTLDEA